MKILRIHRKVTQSESADEEVAQEMEETTVSDSSAVKETDTKPSEPSIQGDPEQVDSSTTEPIVTETKDQDKQKGESEESPADEKKEEHSEIAPATETPTPNKKKSSSRKRSSAGKVSAGKSPRSSKCVTCTYFFIIPLENPVFICNIFSNRLGNVKVESRPILTAKN